MGEQEDLRIEKDNEKPGVRREKEGNSELMTCIVELRFMQWSFASFVSVSMVCACAGLRAVPSFSLVHLNSIDDGFGLVRPRIRHSRSYP